MPLDRLPLTRDHRRRLRQLDDLLTWAESQMKDWPLPNDLVMLVVSQQAGGVHRLARAVLGQVWGGSSDHIQGRMRAMAEALINVRYILADDSAARAYAFAHDDVRSRKTMANRTAPLLRRGKAESMASVSTQEFWDRTQETLTEQFNEIEASHGEIRKVWPPIEQRAQKGDSEELYATAYWRFSEDEHLTTRGLDKFMRERRGRLYFDYGPETDMLYSFIGMAFVYYVSLLNELSRRVGHPPANGLVRFNRIADELRAELAPSLTSGSDEATYPSEEPDCGQGT